MGRIQTDVGLATGINIGQTVEALMAIAARPRDNLAARTAAIQDEQTAITELTGLLFALKSTAGKLAKTSLFNTRTATSSNPSALSVTVKGEPPLGTYRFTPLKTAQSQQLLSSGFRSAEDPIGAGTLSFRFGDHVERATPLELLRGGQGIARGMIRITDRSGAQAEIDLSTALTVDDVLEAVNGNTGVSVTAVAHGDGFRLLDNTGQTASNLKVEEVGAGKLLFGSDVTFNDNAHQVGRITHANIPEQAKHDILGRNMQRILKRCGIAV
jgi:flagellar hook-associated protein 2